MSLSAPPVPAERPSIRSSDPQRLPLSGMREWLQLVLDVAPNAKMLMDSSGRIVLVNAQFEALFGQARADLVGGPVEALIPSGLRSGEQFGLRGNGEEFPIEIGLSPVVTEEGTWILASIVDISLRKQAEAALRGSLARREALLRELHHRVKNNLQIIISLLNLESARSSDEAMRNVLQAGSDRISAITLIHEQLSRAENQENVDFAVYVRSLGDLVLRAYGVEGRVRLKVDVPPERLGIETATTCGMILNELLTNALRHAFTGASTGYIHIRLRRLTEEQWLLTVSDDGPGFRPTAAAMPESLGIQLIHALAAQVNGCVEIDHSHGTTVNLTFSDRSYAPRV